jgi:hypothetical protein
VALTPLEAQSQETAQQRWTRVKQRYQPITKTDDAAVTTSTVRPEGAPSLPPAAETAATTPSVNHAPPLPDASEEPAWILSAAPAETMLEPLRDTKSARSVAPTAPVPAPTPAVVDEPAVNETASSDEPIDNAAIEDRDIRREPFGPFELGDDVLAAAGRTDTLPPMPTLSAVRRSVREMREIQPFYDTNVDKDIREYADSRAAEYNIKFGADEYQPRMFPDTAVAWEPTNFYHYPLYFEDAALERYGHTYPFVVQPFVSVAKFSGQLLALPYQMTLDPINKPMYALGWYRPGECAPKLKYQIPWNAQAAAVQAGVTTGMIFLIP